MSAHRAAPAGRRWEASDIPLVVGTVIVTRLLRVAVECFARELAVEAVETLTRARRKERVQLGASARTAPV